MTTEVATVKTLDNEQLLREFTDAVISYHTTNSDTAVFVQFEAVRTEIMRRLGSSAYVLEDFNAETEKLELARFVRDAKALKTSVEQKWTAWLDDREDGVVGTGETEAEAIKALAGAYRVADEQEPRHRIGCICADCSGAELTSDND